MQGIKPKFAFWLLLALAFVLGFLKAVCVCADTEEWKVVTRPAGIEIEAMCLKPIAVQEGTEPQDYSLDWLLEAAKENNGYVGMFRITRYCPCSQCCGKWAENRPLDPVTGEPVVYGASGQVLNYYYSCAADTIIPYGTQFYIPELEVTVTVQDRAAKFVEERYAGKFLDIYVPDHHSSLPASRDYMEVYLVQ